MALNEQEKEIITSGRAIGKSPQEIEQKIIQYRNGTLTPVEPSITKDLAIGAAKEIGSTAKFLVEGAASMGGIAPIDPLGVGKAAKDAAASALDSAGLTDENLKADNPTQVVGKGLVIGAEVATPLALAKVSRVPSILKAAVEKFSGATSKVTNPASKLLDPSAVVQRINRITPTKQVEFKNMTGKSVGEYLVDRNIIGTSDETVLQLATRMEQSRGEKLKALATRPEVFKSPVVLQALRSLEQKVAKTSTTGASNPIKERVNALVKKLKGEGLNLSEIEDVKYLYERNVKVDYLKQNLSEKVEAANYIDDGLREFVFDKATELGIKGIPELNKETQAAKFLIDAIGKASEGRAANNAVTLTDWLLLAEGAANPAALAAFLGKKGISSEAFQAWFARKISSGVANIAKPKATVTSPKGGIKEFNEEQEFFSELDGAIRGTKKK
jgi:uncharacterized protein YnzC (UPF0291/DUF896 family)